MLYVSDVQGMQYEDVHIAIPLTKELFPQMTKQYDIGALLGWPGRERAGQEALLLLLLPPPLPPLSAAVKAHSSWCCSSVAAPVEEKRRDVSLPCLALLLQWW
jgi:hypothetical protein